MKRYFILLTLLICIIPCLRLHALNGKLIADTAGIKIIRVWGNHYERGFAQGFLLANNIEDIYTGYMQPFMGNYLEAIKEHLKVEGVMKIDKDFHDEAHGMVAGMKKAGVEPENFDAYSILLANSFLDLLGMSSFKELREMRKRFGCSSLIIRNDAGKKAKQKGQTIITRHLDWPATPEVTNNQVIVIHSPTESDEQKWLMIGFAGQISVLSGVNASGVSVFLHMLNDYDEENITLPLHPYEPLSFTLRKAIEKKDFNGDGISSVADVKAALEANKQGYAEGFIVSAADSYRKGERAQAFIAELAPTPPYFTFRDESFPDNITGNALYTANYSIKRHDSHHYCDRYIATAKAVNAEKLISTKNAWHIMKTFSILQNNIQFMQYTPEANTLTIAIYQNETPAFDNKPYTMNLKYLFR